MNFAHEISIYGIVNGFRLRDDFDNKFRKTRQNLEGETFLRKKLFTIMAEVNPKRVIHHDGYFLNIQFEVSRRVTQRLSSEIMKIFLTEVLGYTDVAIV